MWCCACEEIVEEETTVGLVKPEEKFSCRIHGGGQRSGKTQRSAKDTSAASVVVKLNPSSVVEARRRSCEEATVKLTQLVCLLGRRRVSVTRSERVTFPLSASDHTSLRSPPGAAVRRLSPKLPRQEIERSGANVWKHERPLRRHPPPTSGRSIH
ncbi:hypothetical protein EYF80_006997 [Liparis tanakae]|uniref:Uncharacterized protein n=1 Tax=Liparis tanakae TaxID=230148 RepID=A0A4Z2IXZ1_9TELE|nr:hypothetical protein EYF80_006997 [Liparis tanakae]